MSAARGSTRDTVRFLLDGERIEIRNVDPTRTVLQYLREDLCRTGTKEGCAEGDCGACTVALLELDRGGAGVSMRAVNSCIQFLPTLDGCELLTIESLRNAEGKLHPVQQAMVECHGSQCGFCTPGFVMSLLVHFKTSDDDSRRAIDDVLAGNLCRCTGYQPIVNAAKRMYGLSKSDSDWLRRAGVDGEVDESRITGLKALRSNERLSMQHGGSRFDAPRSSDELAGLLAEDPTALLLAGGTDVGLWVTKQHRELRHLIYTGRISDMQDIREDGLAIDVGAAVTLTDVMPAILRHYPELTELLTRFASPPVRNVATLGGNIANGSPIGDSMPALLVLDASLVLRCGGSRRSLPLQDFYIAYQQTALENGEFIERIRIPLPAGERYFRSYKISKRFDQDISAVCGAFRMNLDDQRVLDARVAFGGMAAVPLRARTAEGVLQDADWSLDNIQRAMLALEQDFEPISDMRASSRYRMQVAKNLLKRYWLDYSGPQAGVNVYSYGR